MNQFFRCSSFHPLVKGPVCGALLLLLSLNGTSQGAEPLRWKLVEGNQLHYDVRHHNTLAVVADQAGEFSSETTQQVGLLWRVGSVGETAAEVQQQVESLNIKITMPGGMELVFDSKTGKPAEGIAAMLSPMFDVLTKLPTQLKVTPRGEVEDLQADEEALEKLKTLPAIKPLGELTATEGLKQLAEVIAFPLPEGELTEGVTAQRGIEVENRILGKLSGTTIWKYTGAVTREGRDYERFEPSIELEIAPVTLPEEGESTAGPKPLTDPQLKSPVVTGEALFDREAGALHRLSLKIEFTLSGQLAGHPAACEVMQQVEVTAH